MTGRKIKCFWVEPTGDWHPWVDGVRSPVYRRLDTGEAIPDRRLPAGALLDVTNPDFDLPLAPDGRSVVCVLPGGHRWYIDGQASNCTMKDDKEHRCWVRHGTVGEELHVDKNGNTCRAGAGSISIPGYHGFLHHGYLVEC